MKYPRYIGITGLKKSGKTTTIESLVPELTKRNFRVGTVKVAFKEVSIDVNNEYYDVIRHRTSGPIKTLFKSAIETVFFENHRSSLRQALQQFSPGLDLILIEAFPKRLIGIPQIALLKEHGQEEEVSTDYTVAFSSIPEFSVESKDEKFVSFDKLAEIVITKALPLTPNLNCKFCGYNSCNDFYKAVIAGREELSLCEVFNKKNREFELKVNDAIIPCKLFVQEVISGVVTAILKTLKVEEKHPKTIELRFNLEQGDEIE